MPPRSLSAQVSELGDTRLPDGVSTQSSCFVTPGAMRGSVRPHEHTASGRRRITSPSSKRMSGMTRFMSVVMSEGSRGSTGPLPNWPSTRPPTSAM